MLNPKQLFKELIIHCLSVQHGFFKHLDMGVKSLTAVNDSLPYCCILIIVIHVSLEY